jgi:hypothetical protein
MIQPVRFSFRSEKPKERPDILTAKALSLSAVGEKDISFLQSNKDLRILDIGQISSLQGIEALRQVRSLGLWAIPQVHSLEPLAELIDLRVLSIATPASYDASGRCFEVETFNPLSRLQNLEQLLLMGVIPLDRKLEPLYALTHLKVIWISHVNIFGIEDYATLSKYLPDTTGFCLLPIYAMAFHTACRKCGRKTVFLVGPKPHSRRQQCLVCDRDKVERHIAIWQAITGRAFDYPMDADELNVDKFRPSGLTLEELSSFG